MPWLFSTSRPASVVPCRKIRRPLSLCDAGIGPTAPATPSHATAAAIPKMNLFFSMREIMKARCRLLSRSGSPASAKLLDVQPKTAEQAAIQAAKRRIAETHAAQGKHKGVFRLVWPLDQQCADTPATVGADIVQPVINLREDPIVLIVIAARHKIEIVRQRHTELRIVEMRRLGLDQHLIHGNRVEQVASHGHRPPGAGETLPDAEEIPLEQFDADIRVQRGHGRGGVIVKGINVERGVY